MHRAVVGVSVTTGPFCACLGCRSEATTVIDHPDHGRRVVCDGCAEPFEVIGCV